MKLDLHIHTNYSRDSLITLDNLITKCKKKDIIPAITDHNTLSAIDMLRKKNTGKRKKEFIFIPGIEISTSDGHVIAYYPTEEIKPMLSFEETLDVIREQGAVSCVPHPFDFLRKGINDEKKVLKCDVVEVFNSRIVFPYLNEKALRLSQQYGKIMSAGSDAHLLFEVGNAYVRTEEFDVDNPKEFLRALKKGIVYGRTTIPFVHGVTRMVKVYRKLFSKPKRPR